MTTRSEQKLIDVKILQIFSSNSVNLHDAVKVHIPKKTTIKYKLDQPVEVIGQIDETAEAGLVASARLFMEMSGSSASFRRVVNILLKYYGKKESRVERLKQYKRQWKKSFGLHPLFRLGSEEGNMTNEKIFKILAYGKHLHSDVDKFDEHLRLQQSWLYPMVKIQLESLILYIQRLTTLLNREFVRPLLKEDEIKS